MKLTLSLLALAAWLSAGCGEKSGSPATTTNAPAASGSALTAPMDHLKSAANAQQAMVKTVDLTALNRAIELFQVQEGHLPKDLNELVAKKYLPAIPVPPAGTKIVYDAAKGTATIEKQ